MRRLNLILSIVAMAMLFAAVIVSIHSLYGVKKIDVEHLEEVEIKNLKEQNTMLPLVNYNHIIANLESSPRRLRYISFNMALSPIDDTVVELLQNKDYLINDIAIFEASRMNSEELSTIMGKTLLEGRIRRRINESFDRPVVKRIYFDQFVIQ
jgi:flagellar basal body-associated protein FliL